MEQKQQCNLKMQCLHFICIEIQVITCLKFYKDWTQFLAIFFKMHWQTEEQLQSRLHDCLPSTKQFLRQVAGMFLSQSEQNWLKHPTVDRSCWGSCRLYKSNQTVPFPKKCCPYYQTRYLQSLTRHMLLSGSFPTWFNLIVKSSMWYYE